MSDKKNAVIALIGSLREGYNKFLEKELKANGIEGIVGSHGSILGCLFRNEGRMKVLDLAKNIGRSKSTVTELVNKLENLGYVEKATCRIDGRCTYVMLTKKGLAVQKDFEKISKKLITTAYKGFSEDEKEALIGSLEKMRKNF
jgi:MarR family transcriptional regulator, organic hydroperoxide resistance regulator